MNIQDYESRRNRKRAIARQRLIILGLCAFMCIVLIIVGAILIRNILPGDAKPTTQTTMLPSISGTDPSGTTTDPSASVETTGTEGVSDEERAALLAQLQKDVTAYLDSKAGRFSVCYINPSNGETIVYNETAPMVAASSVKIAYNTYLYKQAAAGVFSMDEKMSYNSAAYPNGDYEAGTGTIQNSANGTEYTIREVSKLSIRISDNCGTNMVLRKLGGIDAVNNGFMVPISAVVNYRSAVTYKDYAGGTQSGRHRSSAKDLAEYARELYDLYCTDPDSYQGLIDDLSNTEFSWGIPAGLSGGEQVAHKVGFNTAYATYNDVAIVFGTEDYILCVMTESGNAETAKQIIAEVSRMVGNYIRDCHPGA
ncbi:MAG: class A beta-lactamase-related serine hydrolase [Oscillospiraceae bacterium]|nr:class A beta-lactamase-related serine hydrolase [Oscillospiraceae bacterium]